MHSAKKIKLRKLSLPAAVDRRKSFLKIAVKRPTTDIAILMRLNSKNNEKLSRKPEKDFVGCRVEEAQPQDAWTRPRKDGCEDARVRARESDAESQIEKDSESSKS